MEGGEGHMGGSRVGSCKGQSSTHMSPHDVVPACFTRFLFVVFDRFSRCCFRMLFIVIVQRDWRLLKK